MCRVLKAVARHAAVYMGASLIGRGISAAVSVLLTRYLAPSEYGILAIVSSVTITVAPLLLLGADSGLTVYRYRMTPENYRRFVSALHRAALVAPALVLLALDVLGRLFGTGVLPSVPWTSTMSVGLATCYLGVLPGILTTEFQADQRAVSYAVWALANGLAQGFVTMFCAIWIAQKATLLLTAQFAVALPFALMAHILLVRRANGAQPDWSSLKQSVRVYSALIPHGLSMWLLALSDRWILSAHATLADVGTYSLGYSIGMTVFTVGGAQAKAYGPAYAAERSKEAPDYHALDRLAAIYAVGPLGLALALSLFAKEILLLASSPAYLPAANFVPWVSFGYAILASVYMTNVVVLEYHQRVSRLPAASLPSAAINIALNLVFVPRFGPIAAAINTAIAFALMAFLTSLARFQCERKWPAMRRTASMFATAIALFAAASALTAALPAAGPLIKGCFLGLAALALISIAGAEDSLRRAGRVLFPRSQA